MFAIVETGGKQYKVRQGDVIRIERLDVVEGDEVNFDRILAVGDGEDLAVGQPVVEGAKAVGRVLRHGRGKKIVVMKYKPKKNYRRKTGHRQDFTEVRIEAIARP